MILYLPRERDKTDLIDRGIDIGKYLTSLPLEKLKKVKKIYHNTNCELFKKFGSEEIPFY